MHVCGCVYSVFVLFCVYVAALRQADSPSKESYRLCKKDYETEETNNTQTNSGALVRQRTIPTERATLVGEVSANFSG
jgi:hypothetical protein